MSRDATRRRPRPPLTAGSFTVAVLKWVALGALLVLGASFVVAAVVDIGFGWQRGLRLGGAVMIVSTGVAASIGCLWFVARGLVAPDGRLTLGRSPRERRVTAATAAGLVAIGLAFAPVTALALAGAGILGDETVAPFSLGSIAVLLGGTVLGSAIAGAVHLGGANWAWVGILFATGLGVTTVALLTADLWTLAAGVLALALSVAAFYLLGTRAGVIPESFLARYGDVAALALGAALLIVGIVIVAPPMILVGALGSAAFAGIALGRRRRPS